AIFTHGNFQASRCFRQQESSRDILVPRNTDRLSLTTTRSYGRGFIKSGYLTTILPLSLPRQRGSVFTDTPFIRPIQLTFTSISQRHSDPLLLSRATSGAFQTWLSKAML